MVEAGPSENPSPHPRHPAPAGAEMNTESMVEGSVRVTVPNLPSKEQTVISKLPPVEDSSNPNLRISSQLELGMSLKGERLGHFLLQDFVGGGGMGAVFRAYDTMLGRTVAVKVLSRTQSADKELLRRFRNEAQSAARLDHENIARVHYVGEHDGWNYIVFEFIDGVNIRDLVSNRGPLPLDSAIGYTLQVAEALSHAAERDVVHRDIKPSNVLITPSGRAKLVDMGLARLHQVDAGDADLTASGVTLGTFDYISPEQARDPRTADTRSDIYSLGCTLFFMITGRPLFPEGTVLQKLLSHTSDDPPNLSQFRSDIPDQVQTLINKMLAKQPDLRHQQPRELIGDLLLLADRLGLSSVGRAVTVWLAPVESKLSRFECHLPWIVPMAFLVALIIALDIFWPSATGMPGFPPTPPADSSEAVEPGFIASASPTDGGKQAAASPSKLPAPPNRTAPRGEEYVVASAGHRTRIETDRQGDNGQRIDSSAVVIVDGSLADPHRHRDVKGPGGLATDPFTGLLSAADDESVALLATDALIGQLSVLDRGGTGPTAASVEVDGSQEIAHREQLLVVAPGSGGSDELVFETVAAAIAHSAGRDGELSHGVTIELHYDGRHQEPPFDLLQERTTIRAGSGFSPTLVFQPEAQRPAVLSVSGGELRLEGLHLEMTLPPDPVDRWALFQLADVRLLRLARCTMTFRNDDGGRKAFHTDAAFFNILPVPSSIVSSPESPETPDQRLVLELRDVVARGEAELVRVDQSRPMKLDWDNGLFITTERLLVAGGTQVPPQHGSHVVVDMNHVTIVADAGLCLVASDQDAPHQLTVDIKCTNSILLTAPGSVLVEHRGPAELENLRSHLVFSGARNFFEGVEFDGAGKVYWRIHATGGEGTVEEMDFSQWNQRWAGRTDNLWQEGQVQWRGLPAADRPVHRLTPGDYLLSDNPVNPARSAGSAETRRDAGFHLAGLLPLPRPESNEGEVESESSPREDP